MLGNIVDETRPTVVLGVVLLKEALIPREFSD